jgi:6-pyruvoyltetrahydropterin/6-carboxytetrahydropterin synthase
MPIVRAARYHDISCGHRVVGQGGKCEHLHGHNYRVTFFCEADTLDSVGRVVDFGVIKTTLCEYLEQHWDHRFIVWDRDPLAKAIEAADPAGIVMAPFNPTAENMALFLLQVVGPLALRESGVTLTKVVVEETRKCSAEAAL